MKKIIILGTTAIGYKYLPDALARMNYQPVYLVNPASYSDELRAHIEENEWYLSDLQSVESVMRVLAENMDTIGRGNIAAVTTLNDMIMPITCAVANKLRVHGPDKALLNLANKANVARIIPEFSPPSTAYSLNEMTVAGLRDAFPNHTNLILKPTLSVGAAGVSIIDLSKPEEVAATIAELRKTNLGDQVWVAQPQLLGELYSLEGYVQNGQARFLGLSKRTRMALTETANLFPADQTVTSSMNERCQSAVDALVTRSGNKHGYFHCEFIITDDSAYMIDANMGRVGGGLIAEQLALTFGLSPVDVFMHVIDSGLFNGKHTTSDLYAKQHVAETLSVNYGIGMTATYLGTKLPDDATTQHTTCCAIGRKREPMGKNDLACWIGMVAGTRDDVERDMPKLRVKTDKGLVKPAYQLPAVAIEHKQDRSMKFN